MTHPAFWFIGHVLAVSWCTQAFIRWLKTQGVQQPLRALGVEAHSSKQGTPTLGGVVLVMVLLVSSVIMLWPLHTWGPLPAWLLLVLTFSVIGALDDVSKVLRAHHITAWSGRTRLLMQVALTLTLLNSLNWSNTSVWWPGLGDSLVLPVWAFMLWSLLVVVGSANAVNLTDGMDGLVTVSGALVSGALAWWAFHVPPEWTHLSKEALEIMGLVLTGTAGSCLGFWWHNAYPARIFMGDVGALALGALWGMSALLMRCEVLWALMGVVFVIETLSVMLQVGSFKLTGRRIFKMAPLHHHFEHQGFHETTITARFWVVTCVCTALALAFRPW